MMNNESLVRFSFDCRLELMSLEMTRSGCYKLCSYEGWTTSTALFNVKAFLLVACAHARVEVTGIFRAVPKRVNPKQRVVRSVYKTYVDVIHFRCACFLCDFRGIPCP